MRQTSVAGQNAGRTAGVTDPALRLPSPASRSTRLTSGLHDRLKRPFDVVLALPLLVLALPLIAVASAAILLTTRQSPLLVQRRVGLHGRPFPMLKLRTMYRSADHDELYVPEGEVFVAKAPEDPRVTPVGRFLRRASIDELPQLMNVLAGHMSLVGPRPALPAEVARYPGPWRRRLGVKPGLTGLWQVSGRSDIPPHRRIALDRLYIQRRSFALDAAILLRTFWATISMKGAW